MKKPGTRPKGGEEKAPYADGNQDMRCLLGVVGSVLILASMLAVPGLVAADVYRYKDENGVWHFTNVNTDRRYRLYLKTTRISPGAYIKEFEGIIRKASERFGVEPSLIKAIIKAESDFDQNAVSHKGAQGLMQLMPPTAEELSVKNPFDAEENILGGTRYLSSLLERFDYNMSLAVAAYNAGPNRVEAHNGIPPIQETQTFVRRVLQYYQYYRAYGGKAP